MFEDALMESGGKIKTKSKYFTWVGIVINGSIIAALVLIPLIYPEALAEGGHDHAAGCATSAPTSTASATTGPGSYSEGSFGDAE